MVSNCLNTVLADSDLQRLESANKDAANWLEKGDESIHKMQ